MKKISIIVPIYNSEKYFKKCIESLVNQTFKDIEIILVNDGSTDNSEKIIDEYIEKYPDLIKKINKENGGQASARNLGLKNAKGKYIFFIDSDDYIEENACEILYEYITKGDYDAVLFDYYITTKDNKKEVNVLPNKNDKDIISPKEYFLSTPAPWNKLYKRKFLIENNFKLPEGIIYEDYAEIPTLGLYNPKCIYCKKYLHYYIQSDNSTMRTLEYKEKYENIFPATEYLHNKSKEHKWIKEELEYMFISHFLYEGSLNFYKYGKTKQMNKIADWMKENYPNWRKNKYYKKQNIKYKVLCNLFYMKKVWIVDLVRKLK